jgi:sodium-dependent dicarboxylate transporter 2/3/5
MRKRQVIKLGVVGAAVAVGVWLCLASPFITPADLPDDMDVRAPQRCLAVFAVCIALWVTNAIPLAATGLLALALLPLLGVLSAESSFEKFGNEAVFFMLGVFLLAAATIVTGLSKRVTLLALQRFDQSPGRLVTGVAVSAAFLSLWMPEHAVAAMIYPILVETVDSLQLKTGHRYAKKLFLALAWGSIIGGVGTFLGGARAPLALSLLKENHPETSISFLGWMVAALPIVVLMTIVAVVMLRAKMANDLEDIRFATAMLDERVRRLGPMSGRERRLAVLMVATILAWITLGHAHGLGVIAVCSATMLFVLRIVGWKQAAGYVNWGVLVMYGGAVALGKAMTETHALEFIAQQVIDPQAPKFLVLGATALTAIVLTEGISNSAAVAIMLPIGYSLGDLTGVDPITMTLAVTIASGLAFSLPISSPPNAISFSAGHYSLRDVVQLGWRMNVLAFAVVLLVLALWWPLLGYRVW